MSDWSDTFAETAVIAEAERIVRDALYDDPIVGAPASIGVGSDSYPAVVTDVVRYKTGAKAGKVRKILVAQVNYEPAAVTARRETGGYGHDHTIDVTHPSVTVRDKRAYTRRDRFGGVRWVREGGGDYDRVALGEARDYRDPHF